MGGGPPVHISLPAKFAGCISIFAGAIGTCLQKYFARTKKIATTPGHPHPPLATLPPQPTHLRPDLWLGFWDGEGEKGRGGHCRHRSSHRHCLPSSTGSGGERESSQHRLPPHHRSRGEKEGEVGGEGRRGKGSADGRDARRS